LSNGKLLSESDVEIHYLCRSCTNAAEGSLGVIG